MKFQIIKNNKIEIIILDDITGYWVEKYCIPNKSYSEILKTRNCVPIILSFKFILNFIYYLLKTKKITLSFFISAIIEKKSKILITFVDNNNLISNLNKFIKNIKCFSIQNGTRYKSIRKNSFTDIKEFPIYFTWGSFEKKLIENNNGFMQKNIIAGSLKYGIYKTAFKKEIDDKKYVVFVSQWRPGKNNIFDIVHRPYESINLIEIYNFCKANNLKFKICPNFNFKSQEFLEEKEYFSKLINNINDILINKSSDLDSYDICDKSILIINHFSSIGFEFLGAGKKVIFLGNRKKNFTYEPGWEQNLIKIPDELKIFTDNKEELFKKFNNLLKMDNGSYSTLISESKQMYMSYQDKYLHEIIQEEIKNYLSKKI